MIKNDIDTLIENYFRWLKDNTAIKLINNDWTEITTPYLDRHNDCLQIYVKKENNNIIITDDGSVIDDLTLSGCLLNTPRRMEILNTTIRGFGVSLENNQLVVNTCIDNFPQKNTI